MSYDQRESTLLLQNARGGEVFAAYVIDTLRRRYCAAFGVWSDASSNPVATQVIWRLIYDRFEA